MRLTWVLLMVILLSGCSTSPNRDTRYAPLPAPSQTQAPDSKGTPAPPVSPPTPTYLSEAAAIEAAVGSQGSGNWRATFEPEFQYEVKGGVEKRAAWVIQATQPGPNVTVYVDAITGVPFMVRQSEGPSPGK